MRSCAADLLKRPRTPFLTSNGLHLECGRRETAAERACDRVFSRDSKECSRIWNSPWTRCPEPQRPYRWDFGKQFRALTKAAGVQNVRIHDLRHVGATILMTLGVPDPIVRKITGHRSRELERYQHRTPELRALTVNLIATELFRARRTGNKGEGGTPTGTSAR